MFKQILKALRARDIAEELMEEFDQMLAHTAWMFDQACDVLARNVNSNDVRDALYERDQKVNELERGMRRKIIRHLTINPQTELTGCLVFMSVAKDAERIGDYCKNVFEVGIHYTEPFRTEPYHSQLDKIQVRVQAMFDEARKAFQTAEPDQARVVIAKARDVTHTCDALIEKLLRQGQDLSTHEAVAYSLLARHFKRVSAHLKNICTAVTSPVDMLDFRDEDPEPLEPPIDEDG